MSSSLESNSNNLCVICLEPLMKVEDDASPPTDAMCDIGTASCGHPCHASCFESWAEYHKGKKSSSHEGIPCPTCQQETTSFVKIFLRAEPQKKLPLSDDEEDDEEEEEPPKTAKTTTTTTTIKRRKKTDKPVTAKRRAQWYKKRWLGKMDECKWLKLEAKNRKKCHHEDLVDLERSQLLNFRLMKQLEATIKGARWRQNAVGLAAFGLGWYCSFKFGLK